MTVLVMEPVLDMGAGHFTGLSMSWCRVIGGGGGGGLRLVEGFFLPQFFIVPEAEAPCRIKQRDIFDVLCNLCRTVLM